MLLHKSIIQALTVATADDSRYALAGIHVDPDGTAIATDGHMMLYTRKPATIPADDYPSTPSTSTAPIDAGGSVAGQTIPIDALTQAAKHVRTRQPMTAYDHVAVTPNDTGIRVVAIDKSGAVSDQHVDPLEGSFPQWDRVLPKGARTMRVRFSARILADLAKAAKAVGGKGDASAVLFEFTEEGNTEPEKGYHDGVGVKIDSPDGLDIAGVIMPMRLT